MLEGKSRITDRLHQASLWTGMMGVASVSLSISLSQAFLAIALLSLLLYRFLRKGEPLTADFRRVLVAALLLYGTWVFSALVHSVLAMSLEPIQKALQSDLKDVWLMGAAVWVFHHGTVSERHRTLLLRSFALSFLLLLGTGFLSVFTPFRLSKVLYHMQHGWGFSSEARLQHPLFVLPFSVTLHMPVGMLGTHLAYGAQLGFFAIPLTLLVLNRWMERPFFRKWKRSDWLSLMVLGLTVFVLFLNTARSALFGVLSALLAGIIFLSYRRWKSRAWSLALLPVLLLLLGAIAAVASAEAREFLMQSVGLEKKHSDYQRIMLWSTASQLAAQHPVIGVGPGMFSASVAERMHENAADRPYLWYLYMQTERGHSHNDFLNQLTTAGLPAGLLYLYFWATLLFLVSGADLADRFPMRRFDRSLATSNSDASGNAAPNRFDALDGLLAGSRSFLPYMPMLLLAGGLFQCYFLDDQVLMPFWLSVGLAALARKGEFSMG